MDGNEEQSTALTDWATSVAQGLVIGGLVLILVLIGYFIVAIGQ
jgi:hypothetical protein